MNFAHDHDSMVALSLSDMFCVDRHRRDFLELVTNDVDVLLANETEIFALFQVSTLEQAFEALAELGVLAAITRGAQRHNPGVLLEPRPPRRPPFPLLGRRALEPAACPGQSAAGSARRQSRTPAA